jgi:hypothetical protein
MFEVGTIAFLKVTSERVLILDAEVTADGTMYTVDRPTITQVNGITHNHETFAEVELESFEANVNTEIEEFTYKANAQNNINRKQRMKELEEETQQEASPAAILPFKN